MNTLNGNFIERSIPNIKNATLNLLIGDQAATMNLADFQAAMFSSSSSSSRLKMKDGLPLSSTLNTVVDSNETIIESPLQLSTEAVGILSVIARASGTNADNPFLLAYTVNNTGGTNTVIGLRINATETAIVGTTHNLMDLQVGGISQFTVTRTASLFLGSTIGFSGGGSTLITGNVNGNLLFRDSAGTSFGRLQLGGTTNLFPSIKRNGAAIDFRLADDSNYCGVTLLNLVATDFIRARLVSVSGIQLLESTSGNDFNRLQFGGTTSAFPSIKRNGAAIDFRVADDSGFCNINALSVNAIGNCLFQGSLSVGTGSGLASAILFVDSTTRGFLMPRMTTAQVNAIVTPAEGLQVYNTTISHTCCYQSGAWVKFSHSPM